MEPITREEYYLAKIAGTYEGKTPEPVTIEEYYLATMAGDYSGNTPQPVTRLQYYMAKVAGVWGGSIPAPVTRLEYYWAAIASGEGKVFPPVTREEHFLVLVADAYSVVLTVVTGNPALLEGVKGNRFTSLTLHGKSTQVSTTGAQLFDVSEVIDETALSTEKPIVGNAVGYWTSGYIPVKTGNYICSPKGTSRGWTYDADKNGLRYINNPGGSTILIKEGETFVRVSGKYTNDTQNFMFNEGNSIKPYEPYTGGKPSPSPEYPQEIESAGDAGKINVNVQGTNLFDKSTAISGWVDGEGKIIKKGAVGEFDNVVSDYIRVIPNQMYCGSFTYWWFYDNDKNFVQAVDGKRIVKTPDKARYIVVGKSCSGTQGIESVNSCIVNIGSTPLPYEPYKPAQTLIVPTPNGLPGIPVSSGGNYTDEKGQQWVCDEVDFKKGVYVQRIAKYISSGGENLTAPSTRNGVDQYIIAVKSEIDKNFMSFGISNKFKCKNMFEANTFTVTDMFIYFRFAENTQTPETIREVLNGCEFWYVLATSIETHLSSADLAAYSELRTYSPTTTVINDAGAGMSVGYAKMK